MGKSAPKISARGECEAPQRRDLRRSQGVLVGFMETFFGKSPYEMEVLLGKYGTIIYLYLEIQTHAKWGRCRFLAEQSTYIKQQLDVSHDLGRNCSECGEFRCMILARGDCLRCWEIFCGEPHSSSKMVIFDRGTPKFEKNP